MSFSDEWRSRLLRTWSRCGRGRGRKRLLCLLRSIGLGDCQFLGGGIRIGFEGFLESFRRFLSVFGRLGGFRGFVA